MTIIRLPVTVVPGGDTRHGRVHRGAAEDTEVTTPRQNNHRFDFDVQRTDHPHHEEEEMIKRELSDLCNKIRGEKGPGEASFQLPVPINVTERAGTFISLEIPDISTFRIHPTVKRRYRRF